MTERTAVSLAMGNPARWAPIVESAASGVLAPNLRDYERACAEFSWEQARSWLDGLPGGRGLNIAQFRGYLGEEERYRKCFAGGFYLTGDLAARNAITSSSPP